MLRKNNDVQCVACGEHLKLLPAAMYDVGKEFFFILRCLGCGLEHTWPHPENLKSYYQAYYGKRHGFTAQYCAKRRLGWVNQLSTHRGKLLDIGCGEGTFLLRAKDAGWQVLGTELNPLPARKNKLAVYAHLDEIKKYAPFDCITLWHALEHIENPTALLEQIFTLLKPQGLLCIAVPNATSWQARCFGKHWLHRDMPRHLYHFDPHSLTTVLQSKKFSMIKNWFGEFEYDLLGWSQSLLNYIFSEPNIFFKWLTGQQSFRLRYLPHILLGAIFSLLALPLIPLSKAARSSGTLIIAAKKADHATF